MIGERGFVLPLTLLIAVLLSVLLATALSLTSYHLRLTGIAKTRAGAAAEAEGAIQLGLGLAARDLIEDPLADQNEQLYGPLPSKIGDEPLLLPTEARKWPFSSSAHQIISPLLSPETGLWLDYQPPGRVLAAAVSKPRETIDLWRIGYLEYLETTPWSFSFLLVGPGPEIQPELTVNGRMGVLSPTGGTSDFRRLEMNSPPPAATPGLGWDPADNTGEIVVWNGGVAVQEGTPPTGRATALGELLPPETFRFPDPTSLPRRLLRVTREVLWPPTPVWDPSGTDSPLTSIINSLSKDGARFDPNGFHPLDAKTAGGTLTWDKNWIVIWGSAVADGDLVIPDGSIYRGKGILAATGKIRVMGDLNPEGTFPDQDCLILASPSGVEFSPESGMGGTAHAFVTAPDIRIEGGWTLFGSLIARHLAGPASSRMTICGPPGGLPPDLRKPPLGSKPTWLLLSGGCQDPNPRWELGD